MATGRDGSACVVIITGVEGSGKTTIGRLLAQALRWEFADADDFHTPQAKARMAAGIALTDQIGNHGCRRCAS